MAKKYSCPYEIESEENFLPSHFLYRGVPRGLWERWDDLDDFQPNFFTTKDVSQGMSVDWSKYANPGETLQRLRKPRLTENGISQLNVGKLRSCIQINNFLLEIKHTPESDNQAHSDIKGFNRGNTAEIRRKVSKIARWTPGFKPILIIR